MYSPAPLAFLSGIGPGELLVVFVVVLILFGPERLPEIAKKIGKILEDLRGASEDFKAQVLKEPEEKPTSTVQPADAGQSLHGQPLRHGTDVAQLPDAAASGKNQPAAGTPENTREKNDLAG